MRKIQVDGRVWVTHTTAQGERAFVRRGDGSSETCGVFGATKPSNVDHKCRSRAVGLRS
jgi:hypothetical protein